MQLPDAIAHHNMSASSDHCPVQLARGRSDRVLSRLIFSTPAVESQDGAQTLTFSLANADTQPIDPEVSVVLFGADGIMDARLHGPRVNLPPGATLCCSLSLPRLKAGSYRALITADAGPAGLSSECFELELDAQGLELDTAFDELGVLRKLSTWRTAA